MAYIRRNGLNRMRQQNGSALVREGRVKQNARPHDYRLLRDCVRRYAMRVAEPEPEHVRGPVAERHKVAERHAERHALAVRGRAPVLHGVLHALHVPLPRRPLPILPVAHPDALTLQVPHALARAPVAHAHAEEGAPPRGAGDRAR